MPARPLLRYKLLLALGSTVAALVLLEIALRFYPRANRILVEPSPIPGLGYVMTPNITGVSSDIDPKLGEDKILRINRWGFKDRDYPREKPAGVFRIAFIGDSVVYGEAGKENDFGRTLERRLNEAPDKPAEIRYQVMNMGVPAYNDCQELVLLRMIADGFAPDLVLVDYTMNDPEGVHAPFGVDVPTGKIRLWVRAYHWIKTRSALVRFVIHKLSPAITTLRGQHKVYGPATAALDSLVDYTKALHDPSGPFWRRCAQCIQGFGSYQREKKVPVVFIVFPFFHHLELASIYDQVEAEARRAGLDAINLYRELAPLPQAEIQRYGGDGVHVSAEGHIFIGGLLFRLLRPRPSLWKGRGRWSPSAAGPASSTAPRRAGAAPVSRHGSSRGRSRPSTPSEAAPWSRPRP